MNSKDKALPYALTALALLAALMFGFYYFQHRLSGGGDGELEAATEVSAEEKAEFVGTYSPEGPLEGGGKRISFFTVNRRDEGGYLGSTKVDTIGGEESTFFECVDVKIEETEFSVRCQHSSEGIITLTGTWKKESGAIVVDGKVIWMRGTDVMIEQSRQFQHLP